MTKTLNQLIKEAKKDFRKNYVYKNGKYRHEPYILEGFLSSTIRQIVKQSLKAVEVEKKEKGTLDKMSFDEKELFSEIKNFEFWRYAGFSGQDSLKWARIISAYVASKINQAIQARQKKVKEFMK